MIPTSYLHCPFYFTSILYDTAKDSEVVISASDNISSIQLITNGIKMSRQSLLEYITCQRVYPQSRFAEHSADFAGNLERYQENRNPKPVLPQIQESSVK